MWTALKKDKALHKPRIIAGIVRELSHAIFNIGPYVLRALLPWHNPRCEDDPKWMKDWIAGHANLPPGEPLPLVDTSSADMPVPFSSVN